MRPYARVLVVALLFISGAAVFAQESAKPQQVKKPDERFKADILVVVAHPDDEGGVTPYLARAIYDLHKRVAVVYGTRGGNGANEVTREHAAALADIREMEAREACAKLGIHHVWFLSGKDTASQNVLNSLASWGHGENLEELVRIVRLTRPEVIISWLPGVFIGENHGDHQAAGVLAVEAFDLAANPTAFPSQLAGASKRLEPYLENLTPWQPKKIYFFSDAANEKQFAHTGPAYSIKEISPSQKKPYWRIALDAATPHYTQFPREIDALSRMSDAQLEAMMDDPNSSWWTDPETLIFGKSMVGGKPTDDVFANTAIGDAPTNSLGNPVVSPSAKEGTAAKLGGPWAFYDAFRAQSGMMDLPHAAIPEIGIKAGSLLVVPIHVDVTQAAQLIVNLTVFVPDGWKVMKGNGSFVLPGAESTSLAIEIQTPEQTAEELKHGAPQEVKVHAEANGKVIGDVTLRVLLRSNALPQ